MNHFHSTFIVSRIDNQFLKIQVNLRDEGSLSILNIEFCVKHFYPTSLAITTFVASTCRVWKCRKAKKCNIFCMNPLQDESLIWTSRVYMCFGLKRKKSALCNTFSSNLSGNS